MKCQPAVILLLAFLPACSLAQNVRILRGGGGSRAAQLIEEIYLLQRLVPLQLTDAQLDDLTTLYAKYPVTDESEDAEAIAKLQEIKQRLLGGTPLVATDLATIRDTMREVYRGRRGGQPTPTATPATAPPEDPSLTPLEQAIWNLLDTTQKAALLGDVRGPAANNQKADVALGKRAIKLVGEMLRLEDARWLVARDRLTAALAAGAGAPDSPQVDNCRKLFLDYLDRLRKMEPTDFAKRQDELAAELLALLPPGSNLLVALAEYDTKLIHDAMSASVLHPRAPELVQQMKAARAQTQAP
ncbi:MAG: hypothetical protein KKI08_25980 [Armatimonadetes bacterium]|nr:hypothetical protein [Armatimonadota bacterium]